MKIVTPIQVTPSNLTSNVPITETAWTAGTYATGTQRYVGTTLYEVVAVPNTADDPTVGVTLDPPTWAIVGAINRFSMFDGYIGRLTTYSGDISVTVTPERFANAVVVLGAEGSEVRVRVNDGTSDIYDKTKPLQNLSNIVPDYWEWGFSEILYGGDVTFLDLPVSVGSTVTVEIKNGGANTSCGELVLGTTQNIGDTLIDVSGGIIDFSRKERNVFGDFESIIERGYALKREYQVSVPFNNAQNVERTLANLRARPVVFIGSEKQPWALIYGFYNDFTIALQTRQMALFSIEVEGLI